MCKFLGSSNNNATSKNSIWFGIDSINDSDMMDETLMEELVLSTEVEETDA